MGSIPILLPLEPPVPNLPCHPTYLLTFCQQPLGESSPPSSTTGPLAHPSWSSEVLDSSHTTGPGPLDPCPCFAFLGRISLEIMTLQPRCEDVETAEGVALTVTGVAQV